MSPNVSRPATALSFRVQARSGFLTLALAALLVVPQVFAAESGASPNMVAPPFQHIKITSTLSPGTVGVPYSAVISVSGGDAPYKFQEQNLPVGLALNEQTGGISGTPEAAGSFTFAIWVTDAQGDRGLGWVSLTVANKSTVSISVTPTTLSMSSGATAQFGATVSNTSDTAATWTASQGTISSSGLFTAPTVTANTSVVVTATSVADPTKSATAIVSVSNVTISVAPATVSINSGATAQFAATVSNNSDTAATWTASEGTISPSGLFTAPTVTANTSVVVTATSVADSTKSATAVVSVVAAASPKVSLEVLFPPTNPNTSDFKAVQQYLMSNPVVSGGNITVEWGMVDQGNGVYDWTATDALISPWAAAGKKVNLIVWANSDSTTSPCSNGTTNTTGNCGIPSYVWKSLGSSNYTSCVTQYGTQQIPNFLDRASFQIPYQQFMSALIQKYGSDSEIGYIRFGLGHGGETYPVTGWNSTTAACGKAFTAWGVTVTTWETYLAGMLNYESTLHSTKQLMVGVTPMGAPNTVVPDYVAPLAVPMNVGFGSQGLQQSDITNYPNCTANWCNLFAQFTGQAPLELQTYLQSCPDNSCTTGSLVNLVPFAVSHHATVLEIYYQDWLLAFDPSYPGNSEYGASYAKVLTSAAGTNIQ